MGILNIIARNLERGSRTRPPEDNVPYPGGYRGMLEHDASRCTGCKTCAYVCSPGAITFDASHERSIVWGYFAEQCTFCGRCVEYCPTQALSFAQQAPVVTGDQSQHRVEHEVHYMPCARCGQLVVPLPKPLLAHMYGDPLPEDIATLNTLCEKCRRRAFTERLKNTLTGKEISHES